MTPGLDMPGVAIAGCGYWGENLVHNFAQLGALRTVCDGAEAGRKLAAEIAPHAQVVADMTPPAPSSW